ncbi:MAG TPA: hypothetical protein VG408_10055, partial [Actinomycetota bacterium]|nr:hypothetical protein [Actinomycetota bacterium]
PFDLREVPTSFGNGFPTGDYAGLVALDRGIGALFQVGGPPETTGATDVFFGRVELPSHGPHNR